MVLNVFKYYYKILSRTPIVQVRTPSKVFAKYFLAIKVLRKLICLASWKVHNTFVEASLPNTDVAFDTPTEVYN